MTDGVWAVILAAVAGWLAIPARTAAARVRSLEPRRLPLSGGDGGPGTGPRRPPGPASPAGGRASPRRVRLASALAGIAVVVVLGGTAGLVLGVVTSLGLHAFLRRLEPATVKRGRQQLARQACDVADLLGACLASGAAVGPALAAVADAVGPPAAEPLRVLVGRIRLGAATDDAWRGLAAEPAFAPIARAVARSEESGAPLADALRRAADDIRATRRGELLTAARAAGVRAVIPLGLCFLPAFGLLGVVPVVASLITGLWQ